MAHGVSSPPQGVCGAGPTGNDLSTERARGREKVVEVGIEGRSDMNKGKLNEALRNH